MPENDYSGRVLDNQYKVLYMLGESDKGAVYLGEKISNSRQVAIKFLHSSLAADQEAVKRFFREARAAVEIRHKNIIRVYDVGVSDDGDPYIVQEYLEGESLADLLRRVGNLQVSPALGIVEPLLKAIGTMHKKKILHRGITTKNIYLVHLAGERPTVKLIDFGLTKFTGGEESSDLTMVGMTLGDYSYIAPEQVKDSSSVDRRADLYSIATILYEMLTGKLPFADLPKEKRLAAKLTKVPVPPQKLAKGIPKLLNDLIMQTLSTDRKKRPPDAGTFLNMLARQKGYKGREQQLGRYAAGVSRLTIAGGDFPAPDVPGRRSITSYRSSPFRNAFDWATGTLYGRIAAGAGALLLIIIVILIANGGEEKPKIVANNVPVPLPPSVPDPAPEPPSNEVQIEVRGLPPGARIYYNDAIVPLNPFKVPKKELIVPLKIEADGYEPYAMSLVPAEDQVVKVKMKTAQEVKEEVVEEVEITPPPKPEPEPKRRGSSVKKTKKRRGEFQDIKKGLKISHEFE